MFDSTVLDVAVGLIFVYLVLSMICSTANELIVSLWKSRSKILETGVGKLLAGMNNPTTPAQPMTAAFYSHPMISSLARKGCRPSYIPPRNFVLTVLDVLVPSTDSGSSKTIDDVRVAVAALPDGDGKRSLLLLIDNAKGDLEQLKKEMEQWFNDAMSRVSGWYKYHTQWRIFIMGMLAAMILNVDTFNVTDSLYRDGTLRDAVTAAAEEAVSGPLNPTDTTSSVDSLGMQIAALQSQLGALNLPIGWPDTPAGATTQLSIFQRICLFFQPLSFSDVLKVTLGWVLTALAISLGAPFWFDLLSNIMNVRIAGKRPQQDAPAQQKDTGNAG